MRRFLVKLLLFCLFLLILFIFTPPVYIRFEIRNYLGRLQNVASTMSDQEVRRNINAYVGSLKQNIDIKRIVIKRVHQKVLFKLEYTHEVGTFAMKSNYKFFKWPMEVKV